MVFRCANLLIMIIERSTFQMQLPFSLLTIIRIDWRWWLSGAILSVMLASILMSGWPSGIFPNFEYPYSYSSDSLFQSWLIQRIIEGWVIENPRSGFPFGSSLLDFPGADVGNNLILKFIGLLTGQFHSVFNIFFLLGFAITFAISFCVFRAIGLTHLFAFSAATIFNFLPFHFQRIVHLYYTWYFVVPLFYYVALRIFYSKNTYLWIEMTYLKKVLVVLCLVALGSFGLYYAIFGLIILFSIALTALVNYNSMIIKRVVFSTTLIIVGVVLNLTPNLVHRYVDGPNPEVAKRSPVESEIYSFKFAQLLIPNLDHRSSKLREISENYSKNSLAVNENSMSSLGLVGSLGFVALFFVILAVMAGGKGGGVINIISLIVLVLFMFGTLGGFGSIFSLVISPSIRGWNRVSVFIGFGAILSFFLLLQVSLQSYFSSRRLAFISGILATAFMSLGLYDQTAPTCRTCNEQINKTFLIDKEFIGLIEKSLPKGGAVYQLPYMSFPEVPPLHGLQAYDLTVGFLHSSSIHWSYAGMKGRSGDMFYRSLANEPLVVQFDVIKSLGFSGIYIDRRGYVDNGKEVIDAWSSLLGISPTLIRADGNVVFFRLDQQAVQISLQGLSDDQIMEKVGYVVDRFGVRYDAPVKQGIDFTRSGLPLFVKDIVGLSNPESWGRWSDANLAPSVQINLKDPLPNRFKLIFSARSFGPNSNQDVNVRIGSQIHHFMMQDGVLEFRKIIDLADEQVNRIEFISPQPTSPSQLGLSADIRKIGIGLVYLRFEEQF